MSYLHEVLAVDKDLETVSVKTVEEAIQTFSKKTDHFLGSVKRLEMFDEGRKQEEMAGAEVKEIVTTVQDKLDYVGTAFSSYLNVLLQKEATNQIASADIVLKDGSTIASAVPATMLLALESRLSKFRTMYEAVPTLQPGIRWVLDPDKGTGVYRNDVDDVRNKTEKIMQTKILAPATDKHPAQVDKWFEDRPVGKYTETKWSSMVSPARKSQMLAKIDELLRAIKQARMRANTVQVVGGQIGKQLVDYINS